MADQALRRRVERLLAGERRNDDITRLFLFARDRCDGRESVQEIGDFVAHHNERTKGLVTRSARNVFSVVDFKLRHLGQTQMLDRLDEGISSYLTLTLAGMPNELLKTHGLTRIRAKKSLDSLLSKLQRNTDGTYSMLDTRARELIVTESEFSLFNFLSGFLVTKAAFTGERLFDDLKATLRSQSLLEKKEERDFDHCSQFVQIFAVSVMHGCKITIQSVSDAYLTVGAEKQLPPEGEPVPINYFLQRQENPNLCVNIVETILCNLPEKGKVYLPFSFPMMTTKLKFEDACSEEIRTQPVDLYRAVEVDDGEKLDYI